MEQEYQKHSKPSNQNAQSTHKQSLRNQPELIFQGTELKSSSSIKSQAGQCQWDQFSKKIEKINVDKQFIFKMKTFIHQHGEFCPKIHDFVKSSCKPDQYKKIIVSYQKHILYGTLAPLLKTQQFTIEELNNDELLSLYKYIGQRDEQKIVQFMENQISSEDQNFGRIIQALLALYKQPINQQLDNQKMQVSQNVDSKRSQMIDQGEQRKRQQELLIQRINSQTQNFKKFLTQKNISIQLSIIEELIALKFNNGPFSPQIDNYIKNQSELKKKKPIQTKLTKAFDEFFRKIQFSTQVTERLTELQIDQDQIKKFKQLVKKGDQQKLKQQIKAYLNEDDPDVQQKVNKIVDQMIKSRPQQLITKIQTKRSQSLNSNLNQTPNGQFRNLNQTKNKSSSKESFTQKDEMQNKSKKVEKTQFIKDNYPQEGIQKIQNEIIKKSSKDQESNNKNNQIEGHNKNKQFQRQMNRNIEKKDQKQEHKNPSIIITKNTKQMNNNLINNEHESKNSQFSSQKFETYAQTSKSKYKQKIQQGFQKYKPDDHRANNTNSKSTIKIMGAGKVQHNSNYPNNKSHIIERSKHNQPKHKQISHSNDDFPSIYQNQGSNRNPQIDLFKNSANHHSYQINEPYYDPNPINSGHARQHQLSQIPDYNDAPHDSPYFQQNQLRKQFTQSQKQFMNYQKGRQDFRLVLVFYDKDNKISLRTADGKLCDKFSFRRQRVYDDLVIQIFRIPINQLTQNYEIQVQSVSNYIVYKSKNSKFYYLNQQQLFNNLLITRRLGQSSAINKHYDQCFIYYWILAINQYSRKGQIQKVWAILEDSRKFIKKQNVYIQAFIQNQSTFKRQKISLNQQTSRSLLYFLAGFPLISNQFFKSESSFLRSFSQIVNFQECNKNVPFISNQHYSIPSQSRLILQCLFKKMDLKGRVQDYSLIHHFCIVLDRTQKFHDKLKMINNLNHLCYQRIQHIYPRVKQHLNFINCSLYECIVLRLTLLNSQKSSHTRIDQQKRFWINQLIKQIGFFVERKKWPQINQLNIELEKLHYHKELIREILFGKNPHSNYFLFQHQSFFEFMSSIIKIFRQKKLKINEYFLKCFSEQKLNKSMQFVIKKTQKYPQMIAFLCRGSRRQGQHQIRQARRQIQLQNIIKKMDSFDKNNILQIINCWYGEQFEVESNEFFISIFIRIVKLAKADCFTCLQLLQTLQAYIGIDQKAQSILQLERMLLPNLKKLPQLQDLKYHLTQIKDVKQSIKYVYLQQLSNRLQLTNPSLEKLQKITLDIIFDTYIKKQDRQIVLKKLYQNRNDKSEKSIKSQIIQSLKHGKKQIIVLSYYKNFSRTLKDVMLQIQDRQIQYSTIDSIRKQKIKIFPDQQKQNLRKLFTLIQNIAKEIETLKKKNDSLNKVLVSYQDLFQSQIKQLLQWSKKLNSNQVKISLRNAKKYAQFLDHSQEINSLMKIPLWDNERIKKITDLLQMRKKTISEFDKLIQAFQRRNLSYSEFKKYFKIQIRATILQRLSNQGNDIKNKLSDYIQYLDGHTLAHCVISINSINQISKSIQKDVFFQPNYLQIVQRLQNPDQNTTIDQAYKKIKLVAEKFKEIGFDILDQDDQILTTLIFKQKYKRVFDMIHEKKIDSSTVLNDLKQYINDVQSSIIKIEDIKQLQNVVLLCQLIKKSKQFKRFLKDLRTQVQAKKLNLSDNIHNIDSKVKQFQQMIDSSANRQTSFKYDIQQIFKHSLVKIKNQNGFAHIQIELKEKQLISQNQNVSDRTIFSFKKLTQFKDKAILLVSDFERSAQNQSIMRQTIDLFKQYLDLYKTLQEIENFLQKAIIYGYNPEDLRQQQIIKDHKFQSINRMKVEVENLSKLWIQGMKEMYQQSYLLTHFMGPKLNLFINDTLNFKFSPLIKQIVDIDEKQFSKYMDSLKFMKSIGNQAQKLNPIDKVKQICRTFKKVEQNTLRRFQRYSIMQQSQIKNKIQLITCHKVENYYFALVKGNSKPEMNQILYCQKQTAFQQIQVFIKRAIIKNNRKHYFIGVHYLPTQVQLKFIDLLNEYLKTQEKRARFSKCKLCFIDDSPIQKVYLHLCKRQLFDAKQTTDTHLKTNQQINNVLKNVGQSYLIQSRIPGLGKTFRAGKIKPNSNIVYFSVAGHIDFSRLLQRLKAKTFVQDKPNTFVIQIGHVQNKNKLEIFLFQMVFFKGFNFKQFFYLPKNTTVVVQIQNVYDTQDKYQYYSILKIIKQNKTNFIAIDQFKVQQLEVNFQDIEEAFTFYYLLNINNQSLNKQEKPFKQFQQLFKKNSNIKICSKQDARKLIQMYFCRQLLQTKTQPTFALYRSFIKLLFTAFKTFSQNGCFNVTICESNSRANRNLGLGTVRIDFLNCCIKNCIQFLQATVNTNQFDNEEQIKNKIQQQDFRKKLSNFPFLIIPAHDFHNYQFVYLNSEGVDISIKSLIISQTIYKYVRFNKHGYQKNVLQRKLDQQIVKNLFSENSLQTLKQDMLQRQIYRILHQLSGNKLFDVPDKMTIKEFKSIKDEIKNYSITLDNFFKMCLIIQRAVSHIPIVIMGESGVGKTALIRFLVEQVFQNKFLLFNIHAGVDEQKLVQYYQEIIQASQQVKNTTNQKVWVFFDQFNTTDQLSYIKQMIIDRRFQGQLIPQNVVLIGACNPYRRRKQSNYKKAGIKKKLAQHNVESELNLAFKVKPPTLSMIQFMWDYQQLQLKQNLHYISKILQNLYLTDHQKVVKTIAYIHEDFKRTYEISAVSLRDVTRFKQLYNWFINNMPRTRDPQKNKKQNPNYNIDNQQRAISLSIAFVYSLRLADRQQRKQLLKVITSRLQYQNDIEKVVQNEQIDYVQRLKISTQRIAINFSLRQNVFTTLVCLMNKIPILIIGNPGNSKSLSIRMISSNLRGLNSQSNFCQQFPQLSIIYFQGSQACTSKGVEAVFQKAIKSNSDFKKKKQKQPGLGDVQNCVLFDQIGLAQKSIHNPLKVLHSKLQTNRKQICFIGISNWELDAAKMSRFLVLSRSNPQKQQLRDTAIKILQSYLLRQAYKHEKTFAQMSDWYYEFVYQWDAQNKDDYKEGFFGLRDFYCYIKYVAQELLKPNTQSLDDIIRRSIQTNFDGQQGSVKMFLKIAGLQKINQELIIQPIKLVQQNLSKDSSRCLLLIVRGDALLPIIKNQIKIREQKQRIQCVYGSTFSSDQQSQEYNLEITSIIISHMSRGTILTFKNPNNSIQTSLYDVFNKSFTFSGPKKYCRVAVGANSNPKCVVHQNFGSIVFMDEQVIKNTDLAFLNRFQKHFLTLSNVINNYQKQLVEQIELWIERLLKFKSKTQYKKQQHYLINSSQQSIVTLVLKYRSVYKQTSINKIKRSLLKNATQHFYIALKSQNKVFIESGLKKQVNQLLLQIQKQKILKSEQIKSQQTIQDILEDQIIPEDKIIFTYDEGIYSTNNYMFFSEKTFKIRISQVKSQRQLRKSLKEAFVSESIDNIHILIDFQKQFQHVNFVAFLISGVKSQFKSSKTIYIIIKLSQISLQNSGRQHINISYLLNFQQKFIDSLTLGQSFMEAIQNKTVKQLYVERRMQQNFDNYYIEAQKRFNLRQNEQNVPKGMTHKEINDFQFGQMMVMNQNQMFRKQILDFVYQNLSQTKIDLSIVLNNKQDRHICSNPQQSFEKYLQNCVINTICCFFDRVYKNNMLFSFDVPKLFEFYKKFYEVKILQILFETNKPVYEKFLMNLLNTYVKSKDLIIPPYKKPYKSNHIQIKGLCLLPMALTQLQYISSTSQDSLFKTSSKILQLSVNTQIQVIQQCNILMERCMSILNEKSVFLKNVMVKKNSFDFQKFLNQNPNLQIFYFFDMISKIYSQSINTEVLPLQKLVFLFVQIFKQLKIKQKVIFLSLSKQLWSNIFNIWSLWLTHKDQNFHRQMQAHYLQNQIISQQRNEPHELPKLLIELCRSTLVMQQQLLRLDIKNIYAYQSIDKYLSFFRKTYVYIQKIRLTCMDLKVQTSETMKATKRFFDLLDKLYYKEQIQYEITMFLSNQQVSFQSKVQKYLSRVLEQKRSNKKDVQNILSYLSLDIYSSWIQRLKRQRQDGQNVSEQIRVCINTFIQYSDNHASFANNSSFFLQSIFEYFIDNIDTIEQKLDFIEHQRDEMVEQIKQNLIFQNNFCVALGNFFMNDIKASVDPQQQDGQRMGMNQKNKEPFLKKYFKHFEQLIKRNNYQNKVFEVYSFEFLKYYSLRYLQALMHEQDQAMIWNIDNLLNLQNNTADHMRLFLLKHLLYRELKMTKIKQNYLDNKKCKWLQHFRQLVSGKTFQLLVPPAFEQQAQKILKLITTYRQEQYQKFEIFQQILKQSFTSPIAKYQFLTFMMNDVYTRSCPQDRVIKIDQIIRNSQFYKDVSNNVQFCLLRCYINHRISDSMKYELKEGDSPQKKIQQFVTNQLTFINYLNIFVACNKCQCPLIEMFFDMYGNVPQKYYKWLQQRFLVNGRQNQSVSILKRFIQLGDNTPGYYKCSAKCDMFYTIGGSGGFGCQLPRVEGKCGWCNGTIGGTNHVLTRANQGARKVQLAQLPGQLQQIRQKRKLDILNHKLNGYSFSVNTNQMIQQVEANRRIPQSVKFILQQMIFSIWSFLSSAQLIKSDEIKQIFQMNPNLFENQSYQIMKQFFKLQTKTLNLQEQDQSNIVWHLGASKQIMKFIMGYKNNLPNDLKQKMGLIKCIGRDTFEQYLSNNVVLTYSSGNQKLALINRSRCVKAGVNLSGQQILRQTGGYEVHLQKYPKIRLIKLLFENKSPCFNNLVRQYKQIINRDYKILGYYIQNQQQVQRLNDYRTIYTFCTKILKLFNMKVTRRDARTKGIVRLYEQLYQKDTDRQSTVGTSNINNFRQQVLKFCQVWNQLRQMKFQLQYGCHTFGKMNQVTQKLGLQSPAINFFTDIKYKGDQKGQMLLSLLQVSSQQYNTVCSQINHLKMGYKRYRELQILNTKQLNPTQIQPLTKTLQLNRQLIQDTFVSNFSNWSVQYGCGLPHYSIDKIQSLMIQHIIGSHVLNQQIKDYDVINFIGEQLNFITQLRNIGSQSEWQLMPKKQEVQKYFVSLKHNQPETFLKTINSMKGSLQLILHYCQLQKGVTLQKYTIQNFIRVNKIRINSSQLIKQELLSNIEMKFILALYQYVELYTLKNSAQCLDQSYKKQRLSQLQQRHLHQFIQEVKKNYQPQQEIYYHLTVALHRFIARSLLLVQFNQSQILYYYLYQGADLWPSKFNIERLAGLKGFQDSLSITLTKMGALIQKFPLQIKKSKAQFLMIDKNRAVQDSYSSMSKPQVLNKKSIKRKVNL